MLPSVVSAGSNVSVNAPDYATPISGDSEVHLYDCVNDLSLNVINPARTCFPESPPKPMESASKYVSIDSGFLPFHPDATPGSVVMFCGSQRFHPV
jgi:hypothetical protein